MKNKTPILILFLIFLVLPISAVFACSNSSEKEKTEKSSCSKEDIHSEKKSCCDTDNKDDDGCDGSCDNSSCHCPRSVNVPIFYTTSELLNTYNFLHLNSDWAYVQHFSKVVYLSIWQPPKIG